MTMSMTTRQAAELDNYITGHWGEDSVAPDGDVLGNLYDAARALLNYIDKMPYRLTAATFGEKGCDARKLIEDLRDALAEVES